jgi:hypothetical protein
VRRELAWLTNERVRLVLLLAVLASLVAYVITVGVGPFGEGDRSATIQASGCPAEEAPTLSSVDLTGLLALRSRLDGAMAGFEPGLRPYEEGVVPATSPWTDAEPVAAGSPPTASLWPAAYEIRWWLESGDDLVADVFVFTGTKQAHDFSALVRQSRCGSSARVVSAAPIPEGAHNLQWRNPLGLAQEDVYLQRGRRVYRVVVVKPAADGVIDDRRRRAAFAQIDDPGVQAQLLPLRLNALRCRFRRRKCPRAI